MDANSIFRRRWLTLGVLNLSLLMIILDNTILNVALPTLARELHASGGQLQWFVDAYVLVFAGLLLPGGAIGDRFGRRGAMSAGLAVFGAGSAIAMQCGAASSLIATRALMGVGAALVMPATLSILTNVFTDPRERAKAIGLWAMVGGVGVALGPVVGGWLLEHFAWSSIFAINIPVVVVALVAGRFFVPTSRDPESPRLDIAGALLSIAGLGSLVWTIIEGGEQGWTARPTVVGAIIAFAALSSFIAWERHVDEPMLDMSFFADRRFTAASLSVMLGYFALFGTLFLMSQVLQFVLGYSALAAGVRLLPFALSMAVFSPVSVKLAARIGTKVVVTTGMTMVAGGLLWIASLGLGEGYRAYLPGLIILGAGVALTWAPTTEAIMGSLPPSKAGVGSAVNDTVREVGGALGVAILGSLVAGRYSGAMSGATATLPAGAREAARDSLGGAVTVAQQLGGGTGRVLADAGRAAFLDGFGLAITVAAGVALAGAVLAARWLPARAMDVPIADVFVPAVPQGREELVLDAA